MDIFNKFNVIIKIMVIKIKNVQVYYTEKNNVDYLLIFIDTMSGFLNHNVHEICEKYAIIG